MKEARDYRDDADRMEQNKPRARKSDRRTFEANATTHCTTNLIDNAPRGKKKTTTKQ